MNDWLFQHRIAAVGIAWGLMSSGHASAQKAVQPELRVPAAGPPEAVQDEMAAQEFAAQELAEHEFAQQELAEQELAQQELAEHEAVGHESGEQESGTQESAERKWKEMDYGPFLTTCLEVEKGNFAYKGIAIRIDGTRGGVSRGGEWMVFDPDTLRWAAGWSGEFLDWHSIVYDGSHQTHVKPAGPLHFTNPQEAGWARPGTEDFAAPRVVGQDGKGYGPIPRDWARYRGLWSRKGPPVLRYDVGTTAVMETPWGVDLGGHRAMVRSLQVDAHAEELRTRVLREEEVELRVLDGLPEGVQGVALIPARGEGPAIPGGGASRLQGSGASRRQGPFDGQSSYVVSGAEDFDFANKDFSIRARIRTREGGSLLSKAPARGPWAADGVSFFVRDGGLCFDIGWEGVVESDAQIADGEWHDVAVTFDHFEGLVRLFVDGVLDAQEELSPEAAPPADWELRIGFTSPDFPDPSAFVGQIERLQVAQRLIDPGLAVWNEGLLGDWRFDGSGQEKVADRSGSGHPASRRSISVPAAKAAQSPKPQVLVFWRSRSPALSNVDRQESLALEEDGTLQLILGPVAGGQRGELCVLRVADADAALESVVAALETLQASPFMAEGATGEKEGFREGLGLGGRSREAGLPTSRTAMRWPAEVVTKAQTLGRSEGAWVVDDLRVPLDNPYGSWFRVGGFDFSADGDSAAVATWMGDVWFVSGLLRLDGGRHGKDGELRWKRFAAGLYQPLGLKILDGKVLVAGRDQITRLHDTDGDGEADWYECFNNDHQVTEHFHEFAMALQSDAEGNLYYMKGARHAKDWVVPRHGTLIRVSADGSESRILASGFRAPNGLHLDSGGVFYTSDQEGHWTPANRIDRVRQGGFYGYRWGGRVAAYPDHDDPPLCWLDHDFDISPAAPLRVVGDRWGLAEGQLLSLSYGTGQIALVMEEEVDGVWQGGVTRLPIETFPTGIMRGRFHPVDGQLYVAGLFGWSSRRTLSGGLYRVRWTGEAAEIPIAFHATTEGLILEFSQPLDRARAIRPGAWEVRAWNYRASERYGSGDYRVSDGTPGRDDLDVESVRISADARRVLLQIKDLQPCHQLSVKGRLKTADGARFSPELYLTVHQLASFQRYAESFASPGD